MKLSKKTFIFLTLVILFAAFLRLFHLADTAPSLYTDEVNQGYNAYSILLTGRDEHGTFLPVSLRSFGDWKPPLSTYLMIPSIAIFGLNEFSVRLPSALFGVASVVLIFFLVRILFKDQHYRTKLGLISSFYLTISPWHILQSRTAMLVVVGLFFLMLGIYTFIKGLSDKKYFYISASSFVLAIYSYYGLRIIVPLVFLFLFIYCRQYFKSKKVIIYPAILGFILLLPLLVAFIRQPDVILGRAKTVSVFYDQGVNLRKWELIAQDGVQANPIVTRFFHNNLFMYGRSIAQRFLSHFDGRYLFIIGDQVPPFQIPNMGIAYFPDLLFILMGIFLLFKNKYRWQYLIIFLIVISILPAAFTFVTPASNRTFNFTIPFTILIALGIIYVNTHMHTRIWVKALVTAVYLVTFGYFLQQYFVELPANHADWWNYGWRQSVEYVKSVESKYNNVIVSDTSGMPYIYFLFYNKYPPLAFQKEAIRSYVADRFGFEHVLGFGKYLFQSDFDWKFIRNNNKQINTLYVVPASQVPDDTDYIKAIYYPNGKIAVKIFAYE